MLNLSRKDLEILRDSLGVHARKDAAVRFSEADPRVRSNSSLKAEIAFELSAKSALATEILASQNPQARGSSRSLFSIDDITVTKIEKVSRIRLLRVVSRIVSNLARERDCYWNSFPAKASFR
uniref:Uncharacterized protein n=1 Tax=Vespula pensylvanica TaxID=30213 RepID=A0A834PDI0_VESPE|nr:hypothetical protein H0235_003715 [Vespula pensylvanica]